MLKLLSYVIYEENYPLWTVGITGFLVCLCACSIVYFSQVLPHIHKVTLSLHHIFSFTYLFNIFIVFYFLIGGTNEEDRYCRYVIFTSAMFSYFV